MFHHERIDGKWYPDGALCDEIPFMSKILALVDVYDAMRSKRPYRNPMKKEEILEEFLKNKWTQFDAELADLFVEFMNSQAAVDDFGLYTWDEYENNIEYFSVEQVIEQLRKSYILSAEEEKNIISFFKALENKKWIRFDADFIKDYGDNHLVKK